METLLRYFPDLTDEQIRLFQQLQPLYEDWNQKINVISRKDIDHLYEHHVLHALAVAKAIKFTPNSQILDLGTGGGIPGIPLAILFPDVSFTLIDSRSKKAFVASEIAQTLALSNVQVEHARAEEYKKTFDFVVSRAVASVDKLREWTHHLIKNKHQNALPNGILTLKGGDPKAEIKLLPKHEYCEVFMLKKFFDLEYYQEKYLLYVQA